jgi:hypothetical protein
VREIEGKRESEGRKRDIKRTGEREEGEGGGGER